MRHRKGNWCIKAVREIEDKNWVEEIPVYHFTVPLPKKKFSDF